MKKFALLLTLLSLTLSVNAQKQMRIWQGGESTKVDLSDAEAAIKVFGENLKNLLLTPPIQ